MILLDVNVLVYAARREFPQHETAAAWLADAIVGTEPVAVTDDLLAATTRLLTHHRVLSTPCTSQEALDFCAALRTAPSVVQPDPGPRRWATFEHLVASMALRGNEIPDALLAATALSLGASLATFDRGFTRFAGVGLTIVVPA